METRPGGSIESKKDSEDPGAPGSSLARVVSPRIVVLMTRQAGALSLEIGHFAAFRLTPKASNSIAGGNATGPT